MIGRLWCKLGRHYWKSCRCDKCEAHVDALLSDGMPCGFRHTWSVCKRCDARTPPW